MNNPIHLARIQLDHWHDQARRGKKKANATSQFVRVARELLCSLQAMANNKRFDVCMNMNEADSTCLASLVHDAAVFAIRNQDSSEIGWGLLAMTFNRTLFLAPELMDDFAALHHSARK